MKSGAGEQALGVNLTQPKNIKNKKIKNFLTRAPFNFDP